MKRMQAYPEEVVGRITRQHRFDRRYRIRHPQPEPIEAGWREVREILVGTVLMLSLIVGLVFLFAVLAVSKVPA